MKPDLEERARELAESVAAAPQFADVCTEILEALRAVRSEALEEAEIAVQKMVAGRKSTKERCLAAIRALRSTQ